MCGSLWLNSTARPPTSHLTPTCIPLSWAGWVERETSTRTTSWNCWGRSLTLRWSASQSANELRSDANDPSVDGWFVTPLQASQSRESDNRAGKQPADVIAITSGLFRVLISIQVQTVLSVRRLFCCEWRDRETLQAFVHYSLTDSIFLFLRFAAILNMFCILLHRLSFFILLRSIIIMTAKMVLMNWPAASKLGVGSIFHTASNVWSVVILIFSDTKWGCLSHPSVQNPNTMICIWFCK